jgi:RNA polymerase sigma factor for flagellar operon FliA
MPQHPPGPDRATAATASRGVPRPAGPTALDALWRTYKSTADAKLRDQLILHYSPLVKYVAGRVSVGLPANLEQADFVS